MATLDEETNAKILNQVEFYFSDSNLPRDDFLMKKVSQSNDGNVICSFSRMRGILGLGKFKEDGIPHKILKSVASILRNSKFLRVSNDGRKVGRIKKLVKVDEVIEQVDRRTIAASPFQYDVILDDVQSFFAQFGKVNSVRLPRHAADKRIFCGTALIEFSTDGDAEHVLKQSLVFAGAGLELKRKKEFDTERAKNMEQSGKDNSLTGPSHTNNASKTYNYPKGVIVAFSLKRKSTGKQVKNRGNSESITNNGGVCKKKNLESDEDCKDLQNTSEHIVEAPIKNHDKGKCEQIKESERMISEEIVNSNKIQDAICHDKDRSSENVCHEGNEKATGEERCTPSIHEEKDVLLCKDLKDVFTRFGAVKHVDYHEGAMSGYIHFEEPEVAMKACAAAEFMEGGLIVKNFIVSFEAITAKIEEEYWNMHYGDKEILKSECDRKRKHMSHKGGKDSRARISLSENDSQSQQPTKLKR